jgi:DNA-binding transcriptional LysR family regulator
MDIEWNDLKLFLAVAEAGSLSGAARALRIGQPTVTRRLAELEDALGYKLFRRTVKGAAPTPQAVRLLEPTRRMAEWAGEVGRAAQSADGAPQGMVRIAASPGVAFDCVAPFAAQLRKKLPKVQLAVLSKNEYVDLARGEADLALRLKPPPAAGDLVAVASIEHRVSVYVAKSYARRLPKKPKPGELEWIAWAPPYETMWPNPQLEAWGAKPVFTTDNWLVMLAAAEAGVGAMMLATPLKERGLVPLDIDLGPRRTGMLYLVCAKSALNVPRVQAVADELVRAYKSWSAVNVR